MSAFDDPRYKVLATRAATALGTNSAEIINAILAQWRCEIGAQDIYPPNRNNPGNIAKGAASDVGATYIVAPGPNPQPGNPIVTFATPEYGADIYAKVLGTLPRYAGVRAAVQAGSASEFITAIGNSGYGTSATCMRSAYRDPEDEAPASIGPKPTGAVGWVEANNLGKIFSDAAPGDDILRPIFFNFYFEAWVGVRQTRTWAPGPKSKLRYEAEFRKILSGAHTNKYIRLTDSGTEFHF
jgi:hypothetical protein